MSDIVPPSNKPFIQLVSFAAKDKAAREQLWKAWLPGFDYVLKEEAGSLTSTYEGFFPVAREGAEQTELDTEIVAFETYTSEQEFERVHMGSPVIKAFLAQLGGDMLSRETTLNFLEASGKGFHTRGQAREAEVKQSKAKPYTLIVTITLKSEEAVDGFLAPFGELAEYVKASEPNTLTYEAYRSKNHPAEVVIFERYLARSDLVDVHMKSAAYQGFLAKVGTLGTVTGMTMKSYEEQGKGVWGAQ